MSLYVLVTWQYSGTDENGFLLQRSIDTGSTWPVEYSLPIQNQYLDYPIPTGSYCYHVAAVNDYGPGIFSNIDCVTFPTASPPPPPLTPISLSVASGSAILTWSSASNDQDYYSVYKSVEGVDYFYFDNSIPETLTDTTVTSSLLGTTYWYQVAAVNAYGTSSFSNTASITFTLPPVPPESVIGYKICNWATVSSSLPSISCSPSALPEWDGVFNSVTTSEIKIGVLDNNTYIGIDDISVT